jgi:hypothetical protein
MPSSAVPVTPPPSPADHQVEASAAGSPVRAAAYFQTYPWRLTVLSLLLPLTSSVSCYRTTGGASDVAPFSDGVPGVSAEKVNVATANSLEPTISTEKAITPSGSDEAVNAAIAPPVPSTDVGLLDDQHASSSVAFSPHVNSDIEPGD